jgi:hypothetical protein
MNAQRFSIERIDVPARYKPGCYAVDRLSRHCNESDLGYSKWVALVKAAV